MRGHSPPHTVTKKKKNQPANYLSTNCKQLGFSNLSLELTALVINNLQKNYTSSSFVIIYLSCKLSLISKLLKKLLIDFIQLYSLVVDATLCLKMDQHLTHLVHYFVNYCLLPIISYPPNNLERCTQVLSYLLTVANVILSCMYCNVQK